MGLEWCDRADSTGCVVVWETDTNEILPRRIHTPPSSHNIILKLYARVICQWPYYNA